MINLSNQGVTLPILFDWATFVTDYVLELSKLSGSGYLVDEVTSLGIEDDKITLDCLVEDPNWKILQ